MSEILFGLTAVQLAQEEREDRELVAQERARRRHVPEPTYKPHPVEDLIEDIALGLTDDNPIIMFLFSYNQVIIGDEEWFLSQDEWERARQFCRRHANEGLAMDSFYQGGVAFQFTDACRKRRNAAVAMAATNGTL